MDTQHTPRQRAYRQWRQAVQTAHRSGIPFHEPWREAFENFLTDMGDPPPGTKLCKNPTGPFTPENCYWGAGR